MRNLFLAQDNTTPPWKVAFNFLLLIGALVAFFWYALAQVGVVLDFSFLATFQTRIFDGFWMTLTISLASMVFSTLLGLVSATLHASPILVLRYLSQLYVAFIRGTPLIGQIYLFFYIVGTAFGIENRVWGGIIILSVFEGAYISEIIRGSLLSLDATQLEAAKAVGFTPRQTLRHVILPQMIARTLPALTGQFASIIKDSSLLSVVAVIELTQTMREITALNLKLFEAYFFLSLLYLALTFPISLLSRWVEGRFSYET